MNTPSAAQPERRPADGAGSSADESAPLTPEQGEADLAGPTSPAEPDRQEGSDQTGDDENDGYEEYEPL